MSVTILPRAQEALLTTRQLSERWGVNQGHLANLRSAGRGVPFVKLLSSVRYRLEDVEAFELAGRIATYDAA